MGAENFKSKLIKRGMIITDSKINIRFWSFIIMYWSSGTKNMEINLRMETIEGNSI